MIKEGFTPSGRFNVVLNEDKTATVGFYFGENKQHYFDMKCESADDKVLLAKQQLVEYATHNTYDSKTRKTIKFNENYIYESKPFELLVEFVDGCIKLFDRVSTLEEAKEQFDKYEADGIVLAEIRSWKWDELEEDYNVVWSTDEDFKLEESDEITIKHHKSFASLEDEEVDNTEETDIQAETVEEKIDIEQMLNEGDYEGKQKGYEVAEELATLYFEGLRALDDENDYYNPVFFSKESFGKQLGEMIDRLEPYKNKTVMYEELLNLAWIYTKEIDGSGDFEEVLNKMYEICNDRGVFENKETNVKNKLNEDEEEWDEEEYLRTTDHDNREFRSKNSNRNSLQRQVFDYDKREELEQWLRENGFTKFFDFGLWSSGALSANFSKMEGSSLSKEDVINVVSKVEDMLNKENIERIEIELEPLGDRENIIVKLEEIKSIPEEKYSFAEVTVFPESEIRTKLGQSWRTNESMKRKSSKRMTENNKLDLELILENSLKTNIRK